jgi:hypothetical protein
MNGNLNSREKWSENMIPSLRLSKRPTPVNSKDKKKKKKKAPVVYTKNENSLPVVNYHSLTPGISPQLPSAK